MPRYTARQGLTHPTSAASEASNYPPKVDSRATFTRRASFHIAVVQQAFHGEALATARVDQWMRWRSKTSLTGLQVQPDAVSQFDRVTCELREDLKHERNRRLNLVDTVNRFRLQREKDQSKFAFAQLENERPQSPSRRVSGSLSGYLSGSRVDILDSDAG